MFVNSDFTDLLKIFNANNVKYLVIGGYAIVQYAEPRFTKNLDLWVSTAISNASSVYKSLVDFGAPLTDLSEKDFAEEGYFYQMGGSPVRVDILMGIPGLQFEDVRKNRVVVDFDGVMVKFISRKDFNKAKRAAGRPQDLIDADLLEKGADET